MRGEELLVSLLREFPVDLKGGDLADVLPQLIVSHTKTAFSGLFVEQPLADELLEQRVANFGILEDHGVVVFTELLAHAVLLLAQRVVEFGLRNLVAADVRNLAHAPATAEIVVDAEKCERQRDQRQDELDQTFLAID